MSCSLALLNSYASTIWSEAQSRVRSRHTASHNRRRHPCRHQEARRPAPCPDHFRRLHRIRDDITEALRRSVSFNLILRQTSDKFDIFTPRTAFHRSQLGRARIVEVPFPGATVAVRLSRGQPPREALDWFRQGGEVSDYQWRDVRGIVHALAGKLDMEYLNRWAQDLAVQDLLARALTIS